MTIHVVGASGATGRLLVEQLLNHGQSVIRLLKNFFRLSFFTLPLLGGVKNLFCFHRKKKQMLRFPRLRSGQVAQHDSIALEWSEGHFSGTY